MIGSFLLLNVGCWVITKNKTPGSIDLPIARVYAFAVLLQTKHTTMDNRAANNKQPKNRSNNYFDVYEDV